MWISINFSFVVEHGLKWNFILHPLYNLTHYLCICSSGVACLVEAKIYIILEKYAISGLWTAVRGQDKSSLENSSLVALLKFREMKNLPKTSNYKCIAGDFLIFLIENFPFMKKDMRKFWINNKRFLSYDCKHFHLRHHVNIFAYATAIWFLSNFLNNFLYL